MDNFGFSLKPWASIYLFFEICFCKTHVETDDDILEEWGDSGIKYPCSQFCYDICNSKKITACKISQYKTQSLWGKWGYEYNSQKVGDT